MKYLDINYGTTFPKLVAQYFHLLSIVVKAKYKVGHMSHSLLRVLVADNHI